MRRRFTRIIVWVLMIGFTSWLAYGAVRGTVETYQLRHESVTAPLGGTVVEVTHGKGGRVDVEFRTRKGQHIVTRLAGARPDVATVGDWVPVRYVPFSPAVAADGHAVPSYGGAALAFLYALASLGLWSVPLIALREPTAGITR